MKLLITGGTGCIGQELVKQAYKNSTRIIIYSRGEVKQAEMMQKWPDPPDNIMRYFIGDVRDLERLKQAMKGCDFVIHTAALKRVEVCEYNPQESHKTNVQGTENVAKACGECGVKSAVFISTDKACEPITQYGKDKASAEGLWINYNNLSPTKYSVVRYANVEGSTGSLLKIWQNQIDAGEPLTVTHPEMTRMWISKERAAAMVLYALTYSQGGEIYVPECEGKGIKQMAEDYIMESCTSSAMAQAYSYHMEQKIKYIGIRSNEKLHETLISEADSRDCWHMPMQGMYVCFPNEHPWIAHYYTEGMEKMPTDFRMTSNG